MTWGSILTVCFFACALVCWLHVRKIVADKTVKGVSLIPTFVFITTNIVEVFYFLDKSDLGMVAGAASMLLANLAWTLCVFWYMAKEADERLLADMFNGEGWDFSTDLHLTQMLPPARA